MAGRSPKRRGVAKVICIMTSQEGFDVDIDGGAGHGQLKTTDDIRVKDPEVSDAFATWKDLSTAARKEGGVCKEYNENNILYNNMHSVILAYIIYCYSIL